MTKRITIRHAVTDDYPAIADVMFDAVRNGRSAYSEKQRRAWVPELRVGTDWIERLNSQSIFVAENSTRVVGFMSLAASGYIDFAYVRPAAQGSGVFRHLYEAIENLAIQAGDRRLWVHASLNAQPAFTAMGFDITQKETVEVGGESLERFEMEKHLVRRSAVQ
jgi:putative acetyltransferase